MPRITYRPGRLEDICDPVDAQAAEHLAVVYAPIDRPLNGDDILGIVERAPRIGPTGTLILVSLYQARPDEQGAVGRSISLGDLGASIGVKPRNVVRCLYRLHYWGGYRVEVKARADGQHLYMIELPDLS